VNTGRVLRIASATFAVLSLAGLALADELSDAFDALKKAQETKNAADVKKFASEASRLARAEVAKPQPTDASQVDFWKQRVDYAKQTDVFTEYALAATATLPNMPPADTVALVDTLLAQNPKSVYLGMTVPAYLSATGKAGAAKQVEGATKIVAAIPDNEDALFTLAQGLMQNRPDQANTYATRLVTTMQRKAKPEGVSDADWNRKKSDLSGRGYYIAGVTSCMKELWSDCDKNLRSAEPLVKAQPAMAGPLYYYLGVSNYNVALVTNSRATMQQAVNFSKQAAAIAGPMQEQARQNAYAMERKIPTMR
jgi:hypothetical protein